MADQAIFAFSAPDPAALQELRRGPCCTTSSVQCTVPLCMWYCPTMPYHYRREKNTASAPRKQPFRHCTVSKDLGCWWLLGISLKKKNSNHSWARDQGLQQGSARKDGLTKHKDAVGCSQEFQESHHKNDVFPKIRPTFHEFSDQSLSRLESENRKE